LIKVWKEFKLFKKKGHKKIRNVFKIPSLTKHICEHGVLSMTDSQNLMVYRNQLQKSLCEIEEYLDKTEESAEAVSPDKSLGRLSRMEAMQDQQLILEARRRKKMQKVAVLSALQRIENNQFGDCIFCGKPISPERLEAAPESSTCVSCS
jgi:DnaK suppressor protein